MDNEATDTGQLWVMDLFMAKTEVTRANQSHDPSELLNLYILWGERVIDPFGSNIMYLFNQFLGSVSS